MIRHGLASEGHVGFQVMKSTLCGVIAWIPHNKWISTLQETITYPLPRTQPALFLKMLLSFFRRWEMDSFLAGIDRTHPQPKRNMKKILYNPIRPWLPRPLISLEPKAQGVQILQRHTIPEDGANPQSWQRTLSTF